MSPLHVHKGGGNHADLLSGMDFFSELTRAQLERVSELGSLQHYSEGTVVSSVGGRARTLFVLLSGMVRFTMAVGPDQTAVGQLIRRGEVFGWAALVTPMPSRIPSAICVSSCTVLEVPGKELLALAERDHDIGYRIMKQLNTLISANLTSFVAG